MTDKPKLIADIRYYENPARTQFGSVSHQSLGTLFQVPHRSFSAIGGRFACKLREFKFMLPGFDHLYVVLTPSMSDGSVEPSSIHTDGRIRYVDGGASIDRWNALNDESKHDCLVDLTVAALAKYSGNDAVLNAVAQQLKTWRSLLEITVLTKETSSYRVDVTFQIRPLGERSIAFLKYDDKRSGRNGRIVLTQLNSADDVFPLCASIAVKDNLITVAPRTSARAKVQTEKYDVPFTVKVEAVIASTDA